MRKNSDVWGTFYGTTRLYTTISKYFGNSTKKLRLLKEIEIDWVIFEEVTEDSTAEVKEDLSANTNNANNVAEKFIETPKYKENIIINAAEEVTLNVNVNENKITVQTLRNENESEENKSKSKTRIKWIILIAYF